MLTTGEIRRRARALIEQREAAGEAMSIAAAVCHVQTEDARERQERRDALAARLLADAMQSAERSMKASSQPSVPQAAEDRAPRGPVNASTLPVRNGQWIGGVVHFNGGGLVTFK